MPALAIIKKQLLVLGVAMCVLCLCVDNTFAAKAYAIVKRVNGVPIINSMPHSAHARKCAKGNWGLYAISGTAAELTAINNLPDVHGICTFNAVDDVLDSAVRDDLNQFIVDKNLHDTWQIPVDFTGRDVFKKIVGFLKIECSLRLNYVTGPEDD